MFDLTPPPHYALQVHSDDPDEVTSWAAGRDGSHSRVVHGTGPYGFRAAVLLGQKVQFARARTGLGQIIRGGFRQPCVQIPIDAAQQYVFGRRRIGVAPGELVFIAPGTEMSRHSAAGSMFAMDLDGTALTAEVQLRHPGTAVDWPQVPSILPLSDPHKRAVKNAIAETILASDPHSPSAQRTHSEGRLIAAMVAALMSPLSTDRLGRVAVERLATLEDWIEAHLGEVITVGRLCDVAGIGERSLQLAFQARRGMTPMRFVCERRLAAAHRRISTAGMDDDITGIASSLGFAHLGRFSMAYREAFGESPSRTLLRSRGPVVLRGH